MSLQSIQSHRVVDIPELYGTKPITETLRAVVSPDEDNPDVEKMRKLKPIWISRQVPNCLMNTMPGY